MLAKLTGEAVAGEPRADNHHGGGLCGGRWLVMGGVLGRRFLEEFEILLADTAVGAQPVLGHVFPARSRFDAIVRPAFGFVVDQTTNDTFELAHAERTPRAGENGRKG